MVKRLLAIIFLFSFVSISAQTTAIPDTNFEQKLITLGIDTNGANGNILNSDALAVTTLTLSGNTITNLAGIEAFTNVVTLNLGTNQFATVPLSTLTLLQELVFDQNVVLANLNLSNNTNLKKLDIRVNGGTNLAPITSIDLSSNLQLEYIYIYNFRLLQNVIYPNTNTVKLVYLLMFANINVDFSGYSNLETLTLSVNFSNVLTISVLLPNNQTTLKSASFQGGNIVNPNFSNALGLTYLSMQQTNTQTLQLPITNTLKTIRISGHKIDNVNFANASNLEDLSITGKAVSIPLNIDISQNVLLKRLNANDNYMTSINVTQNILLEEINVSSNKLTVLNLNQNVLLKRLNSSYNLLPIVNLTQNVVVETLDLNNNVIPTLNLTTNIVLNTVNISNNLFTTTGLDLTQNVLLSYFKASFNQIESLNINQNAVLVNLILDHNLFSGTAILDQFYNLRLNNNGIYGNILNVSFNKLSGVIPNYTSLFHLGAPLQTNWTYYFRFYFNDNNLEFGHFENQHPNYILALNTFGAPPFNTLPVMSEYYYAPQAKVNLVETPTIAAGTPITLTTIVSGAQNHYKWFKNGVAIAGAPDSPNYIIESANPCDNGVYYCEIRSDLVPFENANQAGTNGKNLLLIRNNITLTVTPAAVACAALTLPLNGATNVGINTNLTWSDSPNACGYRLTIGTTSGGSQILNNVDVGNVNSYILPSNLPINATIYVSVTPYPPASAPVSCTTQSFNTNASVLVVPTCVISTNPVNNLVNIPVNQNFSWTPVANTTGYNVTLGTTPGGSQIPGTLTGTSFNPTPNLPQGQIVYLTITPFNVDGNAIGCSVFQFTVETIPNPPTCPTSYSIANGQNNVSVNTGGISWTSVSSQTEYYVTIGTTPTGTQYENNYFNNTSEYYVVPTTFAYSTTYYLRIRVRDQSTGTYGPICSTIVFTTESAPAIFPGCATNIIPANSATNVLVNANITWGTVATATGYRISIGTTSGGTDIVNNFNNGNSTTYNPASDFNQNTIYFVTIIPYNATGNAVGCAEIQFATQAAPSVPNCTTVVSPSNTSSNVAINSTITWNTVSNINGYFISIGTTAGGTDFINNQNVANVTSFTPTMNFASGTTYFVTVTPYNSTGNANSCSPISFTTQPAPLAVPGCATNIFPANNAIDILVNANITWDAAATATGYRISIGTTTGGNDIVNNFNNGNLLTYNPASDFAQNTIYYVTIAPYNASGSAVGCSEIQFKTQTIPVVPSCATNIYPPNNGISIPLDANITWSASPTATGYYISIGSGTGATDILNNFDNGNSLIYNPINNFAADAIFYMTITPYNTAGNAVGCSEINFTTQIIPNCTSIISPVNSSTNIPVNSAITWSATPLATGYLVSISTTAGATNYINSINVNNVTQYSPSSNFNYDTTYYYMVIPYNLIGLPLGCQEIQFTTETLPVPLCTTILTPLNNATNVSIESNITWSASSIATGYRISIGTTLGGTNFVNNVDVGNVLTYNPTTALAQNTTYFVTITPYNAAGGAIGCLPSQFITETSANSISEFLTIPTFFTPNNDGFNDYWSLTDIKNVVKRVLIFDRFGKLIKDISNGKWDGNFNNQQLPASDYWYNLELKTGEILKGHFALKR